MMSHDLVAVAAVQAMRCDVKVYYIIFSDFMTFYFILFTVFDWSHVQVNVALATITQEVNGFSKNKISCIQ